MIADGVLRADDRRGTFVVGAPNRSKGELHYSENPARRVGRTVRTIGIVGALYASSNDHLELNNFWIRLLVQSLEHASAHDGHSSRFFNRVQGPGEPVLTLAQGVEQACLAGVDALVVIAFGIPAVEVERSAAVVDGIAIPVVCITTSALSRPMPDVFYDNYGAGYQAAQHLIETGRRNILFFAPQTAHWVQERIDGASAAAMHAGLSSNEFNVAPEDVVEWRQEVDPEDFGYRAAAKWLDGHPHPSGVICHNDGAAHGFVRAATERGLSIGSDIAILGFDDHPKSRSLQMTSLRPPVEGMGREASRLLRKALDGESANVQICLRWHLIARASTLPHSAKDNLLNPEGLLPESAIDLSTGSE
jgi:DNA-binding LacI/PurR family transcriptional regulator